MIYDFLEYFKKQTGTYNRVFKYMKSHLYIFIIGNISILFIGIIVLMRKINIENSILLAGLFIAYILIFSLVNVKAKKIVKNIYGISSSGFTWNSSNVLKALHEFDKQEVLLYLKKTEKILDKGGIQRLSELMMEEAKEIKPKFPIVPSVFAALFISVWNNFFSWLYKGITSFSFAIKVLIFTSLFLLMAVGLYIMIKSMFDVGYDFISSDYKKMKQLSKILNEISYEIERGKINL